MINKLNFTNTTKTMKDLLLMLLVFVVSEAYAALWPTNPTDLEDGKTYIITSKSPTTVYFYVDGDTSTQYTGINDIVIDGGKKVTIRFNTSHRCWVYGLILVENGELTLELGDDYSSSQTIARYKTGGFENTGFLLQMKNTTTDVTRCKLNIRGNSSHKFTINGDGEFVPEGNYDDGFYTLPENTGTVTAEKALILFSGGTADFDNVTMQNNYNSSMTSQGDVIRNGGAFCVLTTDVSGCRSHNVITMDNCVIQKCLAGKSGGAFYFFTKRVNDSVSSITMTDCEIKDCFVWGQYGNPNVTEGNIIAPIARSCCELELKRCEIHHNRAPKGAGAVTYNPTDVPKGLRMKDCYIHDNWGHGGTVYIGSRGTITGCTITDNYSHTNGGGVTCQTPGSSERKTNWKVRNGTLTLDSTTVIERNHAKNNGGGIFFYVTPIRISYNSGGVVPWTLYANNEGKQYEMKLIIQGTKINDNTAGANGGGIFIGRTTDVYVSNLKCEYGELDGNTAGVNGGGIYVYSTLEGNSGLLPDEYGHDFAYYEANAGFVRTIFDVSFGETTPSNTLYVRNNTATNGGGAYIGGVKHNTALYDRAVIGEENNPNIADGGNGGGVYVSGGNVTVAGSDIRYNQSHVTNGNGGNGGGFYVTGGQVEVKGGSIDHNIADGDGGGFYVNTTNDTIVTKINSSVEAMTMAYNKATNGGGAYVNQGQLKIDDAATTIVADTATISGGGIYLGTGNVTITDATLSGNVSQDSDGGGFYVANGSFTANNAIITSNHAPNGNGGGVYAGGNNGIVTLNAGTTVTDNNAINGGGICVDGGNLTFTNAVMTGNTASNDGGGFYTTGGEVEISGNSALISANTATVNGGGMFIGGDIELQGGVIKQNQTGSAGGGVYVTTGGDFTMTGGTIGGTTSDGNKATGANGAGGGLYMAGGTATISGGAISGNSATMNGGGVYMAGETAVCTLTNNATIGGASSAYGNTAQYGGGIYAASGVITVKGGHIAYNSADLDGGGIYSSNPNSVVNVEKQTSKAETLSYIERNTAANGGGIYANNGTVNFSDGYIRFNHATEAGGGIYVNDNGGTDYGKLFLKGSARLVRNHVPTGKKGGGVYLKGVITVGEQVSDSSLLGSIKAEENFAFTTDTPESYTITDETRNNVYLPAPVVDNTYHKDVITVIYNGIDSENTNVGFSVPSNYVPVIYCADNGEPCTEPGYEDYTTSQHFLHQFSTGLPLQDNLFDDSHRYVAVHYVNQEPVFDPNHVYLYGFWTNIVVEDPTGGHYEEHLDDIDTPEKLAYFISYVNGINDCAGHPHPDAVGNITADIDMSLYGWVPIGELTDGFSGTLNGNGHTITGVSSLLYGDHMAYGIVGKLNGGTIKDLFVKDAVYALEYKDGLIIGGLVGDMTGSGKVENSEVSATILASHPNTIMGGLVGRMGHSGTPALHSCIGIADMTGYLMGGLVGQLEKGDLLNSFANAKFNSQSNTHYQGGLVAVNRGRIENCYFHEQTGSTHGTLFGSLVGDNTNGTVSYCYTAATPYTASTEVAGTLSGHGLYADNTVTPYYYHRRDNQVTLASGQTNPYKPVALPGQNPQTSDDIDEQMLHYLNNWVDTINKHQSAIAYTRWSRPTTKVINDDLPLLLLPSGNAVAATTGNPYLEYGSANTRITDFNTNQQAIYMYRAQPNEVSSNIGSSAELYIDEHVALIHAGELTAHVGITLDNSAGINGAQPTFGGIEDTPVTDYTDWHMFATPLAEVPLGIKYVKSDGVTPDNTQYHGQDNYYDHPSGMPYYRFLPANLGGGYFPSMTYQYAIDNSYNPDNSTEDQYGNYYKEWDFYCYYEPEYHWINFKRNSNDHWHENATDAQIGYTNETNLIAGKGYLVATRENNTFLQAKGVLNGDAVTFPVTRSGAYSPGYNLLGNPYQAYLDFEIFADTNRALWHGDTPTYYILDEDSKDYVAYASQGSTNPARPEQFIHPHQGFMILLNSGDGGTAKFTPSMRNTRATTGYRDVRPAYPLVNLSATEENGNRTMVTVELGRPDKGGAAVLKDMHVSRGKLYCRYEGEDYEIAFTRPGLTEASIRFETLEDTEYTMTWDTHNGEFSYLHLIDNLTGADVDCLAESEYRFTSRTSDYKSRFRLVFGYTGIEEPETPETDDKQSQFAFVMGGQLVVNGEGTLQVFDISGRQVMSADTHGTQTTLGLPRLAAGVYTLRMTTAGSSQVQKIVIR